MYMVTETPIEAFEKISAHLIAQQEQSIGKNRVCLYRGPNDCKCAFGALIPDEVYDPSFEGKSIGRLVMEDLLDFLHTKTRIVCATLQEFHDGFEYCKICHDTAKIAKAMEDIKLGLDLNI